jgi:hypothetical protein
MRQRSQVKRRRSILEGDRNFNIKTPSKWQVRQPIHRDAIESRRRYEPWLGPLAALVDSTPTAASPTSTSGHAIT